MTTHVCLPATSTIFDGLDITPQVKEWLSVSVGTRVRDMTALHWGKSVGYYLLITRSSTNPQYGVMANPCNDDQPYFMHFFFRDSGKATLFKLTWGGRV